MNPLGLWSHQQYQHFTCTTVFSHKGRISKSFFLQNRNVALDSAYSVKQSYLLGAAQHMTLRPGDALLQDPALLLSARDQEVTIISRRSIKC